MAFKSIALCMIVKNEAHVVRRCLDSALPLIDYVLLVDTGSTDGTQSLVREILHERKMPGEVIEIPWKDFAFNRSAALGKLRERADIDYALMIDADDIVICEPGFDAKAFKENLRRDIYDVQCSLGKIIYCRPQLISNHLEFCYKGVLHEYLQCPEGVSRDTANGFYLQAIQDSARNQNPQKYRDDAGLLEAALRTETDPFLIARYTFYLAQSYENCGELDLALTHYMKRAELGFWDEEIFICHYYGGRLKEQLKHPDTEIIGTYLNAYEICPHRVESLHAAMKFCRIQGKHHQSYLIGKRAIGLSCPESGLFIEKWIYDYGVLDEFSVCAYWCGQYSECLDAAMRLNNENRVPEDERDRIKKNAEFALERLREKLVSIPTTEVAVNMSTNNEEER
jgi:hypothetical protein